MDVDFAQIGQNVALQNASQTATQSVEPNEKTLSETEEQKRAAETGKVESNSADNSEKLNSTSFNIESAVAEISEFVQSTNRQLAFSIDENTKRSVVKVTDSSSGEVIRQIPSEEVLALSERIKELQTDVGTAVGVLFNKQV